jgi:hypothetical protein
MPENTEALESTLHAERVAALPEVKAAIERRQEAELAALDKQRRAVVATAKQELADAEASVESTRARLAGEIAVAFYAELDPLVTSWRAQPTRPLAIDIAAAIRRSDERAQRELGMSLDDTAIAFAFADQLAREQPNAVNTLGTNWSTPIVEAAYAVRKAFRSGSGHVEMALTRLEALLQDEAARATGEPSDRLTRRFAVRRAFATHRDVSHALSAFDASEEAKRNAESAQSYVVPPSVQEVD